MLVFEYRVAVEMKDGNRIPLDCNLVNLHIVVVGPSAAWFQPHTTVWLFQL